MGIQEHLTPSPFTQHTFQQFRLIGKDALHQFLGNHRHMHRMGVGGNLGSHIQLVEIIDALLFLQILDGTGIGGEDIQIPHIRIIRLLVQAMMINGDDALTHLLHRSPPLTIRNIR